ncbi:MAG TPA: shikimate kinase [Candidatus Sulfotelmatobacter sp.]|nr:shikimate kinase [Candidatus Sulfotelmatobacter sp.]
MKKRSGKTRSANARKQSQAPCATGFAGSGLFLVGFMGAGKTSVGRTLAQRLNWAFEDLDERIERRELRTVPQIFRDSGEAEFRRAEHAALKDVLEEIRGGAVKIVALGGGAFVQENNAVLLKSGGVPTVFLDAPVEELWRRCCQQASEAGTERPLLRGVDQFRQLYEARRTSYVQASLGVQTERRTLDEIASEVIETLGLQKVEFRAQEGEVE